MLLPFTLSPFLGHGFRLQQASCSDRLSRGLLENTVREQKCKQVERSFVELHSFPCHHTLTLNIPLSSACVVCCGGFCGLKLPKSTLLCMCSPSNNQPSSPRCRSLLQCFGNRPSGWGSSLDPCHFVFGSQHSGHLQIPTNTYTLFSECFLLVANMTSHSTSKLHKTITVLTIYRLKTQYKYPIACSTGSFPTIQYSIHYFFCYT